MGCSMFASEHKSLGGDCLAPDAGEGCERAEAVAVLIAEI